MNTHCTEDELLQFALGVLNGQAESRIRTHVVSCAQCATRLNVIKETLSALKECDPQISVDIPVLSVARGPMGAPEAGNGHPLGKHINSSDPREFTRLGIWIRFAAVLCVGIGIGYASFGLFHPPQPTVFRQLVVPRASDHNPDGFAVCSVDGLQTR
jgi:hypothetical protein